MMKLLESSVVPLFSVNRSSFEVLIKMAVALSQAVKSQPGKMKVSFCKEDTTRLKLN